MYEPGLIEHSTAFLDHLQVCRIKTGDAPDPVIVERLATDRTVVGFYTTLYFCSRNSGTDYELGWSLS
jgi:hypothetical protein